MRKIIVTAALAAAGLSLAACGSAAASHTATSPPATSAAPAAVSARPAPALPKVGQPVRAGVFTFTVTKFECGLKILGQPGNGSDGNGPGGLSTPLHGQFCVAAVSESNTSSQPQSLPFDAGMFGTNSSTYTNDTDPVVMTNAQIEYLPAAVFSSESAQFNVNPGTTYQEVFVWDVPASVHPARVIINSGFDSDFATVNVAGSSSPPATAASVATKTEAAPVVTKTVTAAPAAAAAPALTACGTGYASEEVYAGPDTSCPFALNVESDYWQASGRTFDVYSPVTGLTYSMTASSGSPVVVTGGNSALVEFTG